MSSNIKIQKICIFCGNEFTAKKTTTQYCSDPCGKRAYKSRKRSEKIINVNTKTETIKNQFLKDLKEKEFLTVTEVSILINCSRQNVYKLINTGKLKAKNILQKKTLVRRSDIDELFADSQFEQFTGLEEQIKELYEWKKAGQFEIEDCYTLPEIQEKFGISDSGIRCLITRNNIPKIKKGWYIYVPKQIIEKYLNFQ